MSRQTLTEWRRGGQLVPLAAFLAACELAALPPSSILALAEDQVQA